ncbi:alpha/beta-hydrolase [Apiospora saccharicola]
MLTPVLHRSYVRLAPFAGTLKRHVAQRQHLLAITIHRSASNKVALPEPYDTMALPDGRTLSWSEAGDPNGDPLFLFHGHPGSRLDVFSLKKLGRRLNIRLIAPDRPGMGRSTFYQDRGITDWPRDVQNLARRLGIYRYAVLGGSGEARTPSRAPWPYRIRP